MLEYTCNTEGVHKTRRFIYSTGRWAPTSDGPSLPCSPTARTQQSLLCRLPLSSPLYTHAEEEGRGKDREVGSRRERSGRSPDEDGGGVGEGAPRRAFRGLAAPRGRPQEGAAVPLLPRLGATVPPPATATEVTGGSGASSQWLLQAEGRRMLQEGGLASLLPRLGATAPPPAAGAKGSGSPSPSLLQAVGHRMPQKGGLVPLLPRLGDAVPSYAMPWRFHQVAGLRSSAHAGEQIPNATSEEYITRVQKLYKAIKDMESSMAFLESTRGLLVVLLLVAAFTFEDPIVSAWAANSRLARKLPATKKKAEQLVDDMSHHQDMLQELKRSLPATPQTPATVLPAAPPAPSSTSSDH